MLNDYVIEIHPSTFKSTCAYTFQLKHTEFSKKDKLLYG